MVQETLVHQSPNCGGVRPAKISAIVMHDTGGYSAQSALSWFDTLASGVSAHVVIDTDGTIYRVVPDNRVAWHAGKSSLHGVERVNDFSLGVELVDANDLTPYPTKQWSAAVDWVAWKCGQYQIPLNRVVPHAAVALPRGRKIDPGPDFNWSRFLRDVALKL